MKEKAKISIYLQSGTVFEYECDAEAAREHTDAIIRTGYRRVNEDGTLIHYSPSLVMKVKATNQSTLYGDKVRGT